MFLQGFFAVVSRIFPFIVRPKVINAAFKIESVLIIVGYAKVNLRSPYPNSLEAIAPSWLRLKDEIQSW